MKWNEWMDRSKISGEDEMNGVRAFQSRVSRAEYVCVILSCPSIRKDASHGGDGGYYEILYTWLCCIRTGLGDSQVHSPLKG